MNLAKSSKLGATLLWREIKSGQLRVMTVALILAVTVATIISVFSARMDAGMLAKSTELLGADLRLRSSQEIPSFYQEKAEDLGFATTRTAEFPSVVLAGDEMALSAVKAVGNAYPLKGRIFTSQSVFTAGEEKQHGPKPGEVWVESRLLALLNASLGDIIEVGKSTFKVTEIIQQESDRGGNFYSLSPRLMMHIDDLEGSGLIQTGSRVTWRLFVAEPEIAAENQKPESQTANAINISEYREWLEPRLGTTHSIESLDDSNLALAASLDKASQYLSLAAVLAIMLAGVAIAMSAKEYSRYHFDTAAMLKTMGASRKQVLTIFICQLIALSLVSIIIGLLLGSLIQQQLVNLLSSLFVNELPSAPWAAWAVASITAPVTLLGFAVPELMRISQVSPLRIIRRDLEPMDLSASSLYLFALLSLFGLCWWFTGDLKMSLIIIVGGAACLLILLSVLKLSLKALYRIIPSSGWSAFPRLAWQRVFKNVAISSTQIMAFALISMIMIIISVVRSDLLADWQRSLPSDAPNFFSMNIQGFEAEPYKAKLEAQNLVHKPLFPMVPGRLTHINEAPVKDDPSRREDPALQRDLALTWSAELPEGNKILEGRWLEKDEQMGLSIESRVAKRLKVVLGDELRFEVAGQSFAVTVSSIRSVDWGTLSPNFYMILTEDALKQLPVNFLTSFYIAPGQEGLLTELIREFPTVTLLDMNMVFTQIQTLLEQVTLAVEYLLVLVLFGGVLVLIAAIVTSTDERMKQSAMLRVFGASRSNIRTVQWGEFALLGLAASVIALLGAEAICALLYTQLLDLDYQPQYLLWLSLPPLSSLGIMLIGASLTRKVVNQTPVESLRSV